MKASYQFLLTALLLSFAAIAHAATEPVDQKPTYQYSLRNGQVMPLFDLFFLIVPVIDEKKDTVGVLPRKFVWIAEEEKILEGTPAL